MPTGRQRGLRGLLNLRLTLRPHLLLGVLLCSLAHSAHADLLGWCAPAPQHTAAQQSRLFQLASLIKTELEQSGQGVALLARSGLDLARIGQRYSHAGLSLRDNPNGRWSIRQLYYACDERQPGLFDQGLAGFMLGALDPTMTTISVVMFPPTEAARTLEQAALNRALAISLLGARYSANAYPFSDTYQNCNQWLIELLATAWRQDALPPDTSPRQAAQHWLREQAYEPTPIQISQALMGLSLFVPWIHRDDHPPENLAQQLFQVSLPAAIEQFVKNRLPDAQRIEYCLNGDRVTIRRGWQAIAPSCAPEDGDEVIALR